ncbi:MAG: MBL fold metallo-hydrolase [Acidaminococcaceae bacterium]|nr:MBL fold metallo-hydrolase [Acidaminococcaceae bacterium]
MRDAKAMNQRKIFACIMVLFAIMVLGCNATTINTKASQQDTPKSNPVATHQKEDFKKYASYPFTLTMLDVGQGLCILVRSGDEYLVYDGGGRERSSYVVSFFRKNQINKIKYLVASHYDEDHIAGLIGLLKTASVSTAIVPNYQANTKIYSSFQSALKKAGSVVYAKAGTRYKVGEANFDILYATDNTEEKENNKSTVIRIEYKNFSCIITGDAAAETESKLVNKREKLSCDLYVVGHHGSSSSSSPGFVAAMKPKLAFISVGKDNKYYHPTKRVIKTLENNNSTVYRTDTQGTVTLVHDGVKYSVHVTKDE